MIRTIKKIALFLFVLFFTPLSYGATKNGILDIGVLPKKNGKALIFIFKNPTGQKDRKIKFNGNRLNIILYNFATELKDAQHVREKIPAIKDFILADKAGNINITLVFKDAVKDLLSNKSITFLTEDPYMLGIMFTKDYLDRFHKTKTALSKEDQKIRDQQTDKGLDSDVKVNSEREIKSAKDNKNEDIELPFVKYEDIFAIPTSTEKVIKDRPKQNAQTAKKDEDKDKSKKQQSVERTAPLTNKFTSTGRELSSGGVHLALLNLVASLSAVLGIVIVSLFLWKKMLFFKNKGNSQLIKILGVHYFGTRQSIAVVQVGEEKFLLGITADNIQLITKLNPGVIQSFYSASEEDKQESSVISQKAADALRKKFAQLKRV